MATATPAPSPASFAAELLAALARAKAERLVAFRCAHTPGLWECKGYHIRETGPRPQDVACDCADAVFRGRICKHAVCVVFARKHGIRPIRPIGLFEGAEKAHTPTERFCARCQVNPVVDGFRYCASCATPDREVTLAQHVDAYGAAYVRSPRLNAAALAVIR